jgi:hypothetical protein
VPGVFPRPDRVTPAGQVARAAGRWHTVHMRSERTSGWARATTLTVVLAALLALPAAAAVAAGCGAAASQGSEQTTAASTTASSPAAVTSPAPDASVAAASPAASPDGSPSATPSATPSPEPPLDKPTKKHPLRVYFGGDSLSGLPAIMLGQLTQKNGLGRVKADYVESSRLTYGEPVDWPAHLKQQMSAGHYDVGIFMIGANDSGMPMIAGGDSVMYPKKKWLEEYERRAKQIAAIMLRAGVKRVYWVGMPIMPSGSESKKMRDLNKLFEDVAASSPDVAYVDSYDLLSTKSGDLKTSLRSGDGVHYTNDGAMVVAKAVWQQIKQDWGGRSSQ